MVDNLLGKVMDVDHKAAVTLPHQPMDVEVEQGLTIDRHQGLGHGVSKGLQPGAKTRSQNHCLFHTFFLFVAKLRIIYQ